MNPFEKILQNSSPKLGDREVAELISRMSLLLKSVVLSTLILASALAITLWGYFSHIQLVIWVLVENGLTIALYFQVSQYLKIKPPVTETRRWARLITLNLLAEGFTWGFAGMCFFVDGSLPHQIILISIVIGIGAASIFTTAFWPMTMYAFATPSLGLTAIRLAMEGSLPYQVLSLVMVFYLIMLYQMVNQAYRINIDAIVLRFNNQDLIDQLKEQKEIAEHANVAKSKFLAAASHDLRQPLHALGLFASALDERIKYPEVRSLVTNINHSVAALEGLLNALLDISRLDAGIILPKLQHFPLKELMDRLATDFAEQAHHKGLYIQLEGIEVTVYSDPVLLETMLRNLISNAIRFTVNGEVKITWEIENSLVKIEVHDTGVGIPEGDREHIFDEFLQLNNPERDRTKGLGLGLAIVRKLAGLLQCTVSVQSTVGVGSIFQLDIPLGDTALITEEKDSELQQLENEPSMLVLVIDDEASVREAMTAVITNWGHEVVAVSSLTEALQSLKRAPQAIIADYRLREEQTGIEAIGRIQEAWGSRISSLIVTGDTAPERLREAQKSGYSFLHKPVNSAKLRAFLRSVGRKDNLTN